MTRRALIRDNQRSKGGKLPGWEMDINSKEETMTVKTRKNKIENLIPKVTRLISKGGIYTTFDMPGSQPHSKYHVVIPRRPTKKGTEGLTYIEYHCTCHDKSRLDKFSPCRGNSNGTICYHSLAAFKVRSEGKITFCDDFLSAVRLLSFGGQLIKIATSQGRGVVWGVYKNA